MTRDMGASPDGDRVLSPSATEPIYVVSAHSGDAPLRGAGVGMRPDYEDGLWVIEVTVPLEERDWAQRIFDALAGGADDRQPHP